MLRLAAGAAAHLMPCRAPCCRPTSRCRCATLKSLVALLEVVLDLNQIVIIAVAPEARKVNLHAKVWLVLVTSSVGPAAAPLLLSLSPAPSCGSNKKASEEVSAFRRLMTSALVLV